MNCTAEMLRLYAVTDRAWVGKLTLPQQVEAALKGGATCVQLREKNLADSSVLAEAREISALCKQYRVPFILNDNVALAAQCGADGVHLGQEDMDPAQARRILGPDAIIGGSLGYALKTAISQGVKRGLFSNEAGMGSTPHAHALANVKNPHEQGTVAIIGVFIDMFVILTLNALVIISTLYTEGGPLHGCGAAAAQDVLKKTNLAQTAFGVVFGESAGNMFVAVCLFFFAFSTILSWNLFGKINVSYLFGKKSTVVYTVLALVFIFLGTMMSNDLVWELSDMFNNLMVIPNAVALFALTSLVVKHADDPVARPSLLGTKCPRRPDKSHQQGSKKPYKTREKSVHHRHF